MPNSDVEWGRVTTRLPVSPYDTLSGLAHEWGSLGGFAELSIRTVEPLFDHDWVIVR